ncbi:MAG: HIT family protein [Chlamydiota bacterium]
MKRLLLVLAVLAIVGGFYALHKKPADLYAPGAYCAFCDEKVLDAQKFYEDDLVLALYTHRPIFPGHCLVITKRHVPRFEELSEEEALRIDQILKKVDLAVSPTYGTSSYLLLQKNGREAGQSVPHLHFHYIPRKAGDDSFLGFFYHMALANLKKPIEPHEMQGNVLQLKDRMRTAGEY